jgi:hypothetical protein
VPQGDSGCGDVTPHPASAPPPTAAEPGTVEVLAVREADVVVVDALVDRPERLALLERHVAPIAPMEERNTRQRAPPTPRNPPTGRRRQLTQETVGVGTLEEEDNI